MTYDQEKYRALGDAREKDKQEKDGENSLKNNTEKGGERTQNPVKSIKNLAKNITPLGILSLFSQIQISDWVYVLAFVAAVAKDFLDLVEATGVLYALVIVATFLCSLFIAMMMLLGGSSGGIRKTQKKIIQKWLTLLGGTAAEIVFGVNFLPLETLTVVVIYWMVLSERKEEASENRETKLASQEG